ncbi:hypothetical protein LCGC14_0160550 [marine sediment metagenome]|uniref:UvrABC system protein B n=1 Tax=marine sediment metagenome TaxID=412755 RepID=A0A0F9VBE3_9ZZZZ
MRFKLYSKFRPTGGQPKTIEKLTRNLKAGVRHNVLLGVTGSGKTAIMSWIIEKIQKPVLLIVANKTLAAQLYQEFKEFFPKNGVHYFVSYYDYYQPEAYIPQTDTYIEKDAKINEEIDRLRHAAIQDLLNRRDCVVIASVSCIYNIGSPKVYRKVSLEIKSGQKIKRRTFLKHLTGLRYQRNDIDFKPGSFRVRGNIVDIYLVTGEKILRIEFLGDKINNTFITPAALAPGYPLFAHSKALNAKYQLFPAHFWVTPQEKLNIAIENIKLELQEKLKEFGKKNKEAPALKGRGSLNLVERQRLERRTKYDLEMLKESGFCHGIENYSRHLEFRKIGEPPYTLMDYFSKDFLIFIDESHLTIPQLKAMAIQDRARKETLIEHGFRLPSAVDNRPLTFEEFNKKAGQIIYFSATPNKYEIEKTLRPIQSIPVRGPERPLRASRRQGHPEDLEWRQSKGKLDKKLDTKAKHGAESARELNKISPRPEDIRPSSAEDLGTKAGTEHIVEQLIRPTGLLEPSIEIRPTKNQVKDLIKEIKKMVGKKQRTLALTLTKRLAEDLSGYLTEEGVLSQWLHSEIKTLERPQILKGLREGKYDVLVGINLLREGLDLPEVALVAILDADKEGFLRSKTTLIQTMGRAARHLNGHVILYADKITRSIQEAIQEVKRRRKIQMEYNMIHKITPAPIIKEIREWPFAKKEAIKSEFWLIQDKKLLEKEMEIAAKNLDFERAAKIRDLIEKIKNKK